MMNWVKGLNKDYLMMIRIRKITLDYTYCRFLCHTKFYSQGYTK